MKIIKYIFLALAVLLFSSCVKDSYRNTEAPEINGQLYIEVLDQDGEAIDKIETVRFLVFKDAFGIPQLELNQRFDVPAVSPGEDEVSKFEVILEVSRRPGGGNDKMVAVIVNEPQGMQGTLDMVQDYNGLAEIQLDFADFINPNHLGLQEGKTMPMTGVVWTDKVYETSGEAQADPVKMGVARAVARVDVFIRKQQGVSFDLGTGSSVILKNTYGKEYFVRNGDQNNKFGKIQTVTSGFLSKSWTAAATGVIPDTAAGDNGLLLCSFYTPERTSSAPADVDKLILDISISSSQGETRNATAVLDELYLDNVKTTIVNIERNNAYRVILTVMDIGIVITSTILDWSDEDFEIGF